MKRNKIHVSDLNRVDALTEGYFAGHDVGYDQGKTDGLSQGRLDGHELFETKIARIKRTNDRTLKNANEVIDRLIERHLTFPYERRVAFWEGCLTGCGLVIAAYLAGYHL